MSEPLSYGELAWLYDLIYRHKDYEGEARRLRALLGEAGVADGARVLEVACGTGKHLGYLSRWYAMTGCDLHAGMLREAYARVPDGRFFRADMTTLAVDEPFDALLCLFSSIGYVRGADALAATARRFAAAVRPGGAVIVEPWLTPDAFEPGTPSLLVHDGPDLEVARACVVRAEDGCSVLEFHWLVARRDDEVRTFVERHDLWMATRAQMRAALESAGLEVTFVEPGLFDERGIWVGRKG